MCRLSRKPGLNFHIRQECPAYLPRSRSPDYAGLSSLREESLMTPILKLLLIHVFCLTLNSANCLPTDVFSVRLLVASLFSSAIKLFVVLLSKQ